MIDFHSHLPALLEMVAKTRGPVLELGCGEGSTLVLHEVCRRMDRWLVTLDSNAEWLGKYRHLEGTGHRLRLIEDWDAFDLATGSLCPGNRFSVALIDHAPGERRHLDVMRLRHRAEIFVLHDAEPGAGYIYQYGKIAPAFPHRRTWSGDGPHTAVVSDSPLP